MPRALGMQSLPTMIWSYPLDDRGGSFHQILRLFWVHVGWLLRALLLRVAGHFRQLLSFDDDDLSKEQIDRFARRCRDGNFCPMMVDFRSLHRGH